MGQVSAGGRGLCTNAREVRLLLAIVSLAIGVAVELLRKLSQRDPLAAAEWLGIAVRRGTERTELSMA
jgi:hypothetical protein